MVVDEHAETYPLEAADVLRYLPGTDCGRATPPPARPSPSS